MASRALPGLGLIGFFGRGNNNWDQDVDANWLKLSSAVQLVVESITAALPASPANGVVTVNPANKRVSVRDNGAWVEFVPSEGWVAYVKDVGRSAHYKSGAWVLDAQATFVGAHTASLSLQVAVVDIDLAGVKVASAAGAVPDGSLIVGLQARTLEAVTGSTGVYLDIGAAGTWGHGFSGDFSPLGTAVGSVRPFCAPFSPPYAQFGALAVNACVIDNTNDTFTAGKIRVAVYYIATTPLDALP